MKKLIILIIVSLAMFMESVDTTALNTAIPAMAKSLQVNPISLKLALISYLLSLAIFIPISGWMADKYGVKKIFLLAIGIFTLSSIWCGFTQNLTQLIIARILQGIGGSMTMPVGRLIIVRTSKRHELISKMSIVVMIAALGMFLGPVVGGIITKHFSWHWIFWVNVPIGIMAIALGMLLLPSMPPRPVYVLDKIGFLLFGSSLALLTFGLSFLSESREHIMQSILVIAAAFILLIAYSIHSRKKPHPIVKMELFQIRTFRVSVVANLICRIGFGGVPFVLPLLLQIAIGYSPQSSGLLLAPVAVGVLVAKPFSLSFLRRLGYKKLLLINTTLISLCLLGFTQINASSSIYFIALLTFIYGFLMSMQYTGMNSLAYATVAQEDVSAATSIMSTIQQLSQSFGVAIAAIIINLLSYLDLGYQALTMAVFHQTFLVLSFLTLLSVFWFLQLKKEDGMELIINQEV